MTLKERIEKLRGLMREKNIQTYIIPSFDAHQSEYVAEYYKIKSVDIRIYRLRRLQW